jgi:hypothetical protein
MSLPPDAPLPADLEALLDAERSGAPSPPPGSLDRMWARVERSLDAGEAATFGRRRAPVVRLVTAAFVAGGIVGAGLHALFARAPADRVTVVERHVDSQALPPPQAAPSPADAASASVDEPHGAPAAASAHGSAASSGAGSLNAERRLLDRARDALATGDGPRALELTGEHTRRFARPQLAEEREAIAVQALISIGRYVDARARAARFERSWPNSLFLPAVEASVTSIP